MLLSANVEVVTFFKRNTDLLVEKQNRNKIGKKNWNLDKKWKQGFKSRPTVTTSVAPKTLIIYLKLTKMYSHLVSTSSMNLFIIKR